MKVRELRIRDYRNFKGTTTIQFWDEMLGRVRPITVLVGSNGSGKTTVLRLIVELIEELAQRPRLGQHPDLFIAGGAAGLFEFQWGPTASPTPIERSIGIGKDVHHLTQNLPNPPLPAVATRDDLPSYFSVDRMIAGERPLQDGVLFFPHNRWTEKLQHGVIEPPAVDNSWIWTFSPATAWAGSLSHFWVWQNYLDLEQGREGRPNLAPFVEIVEEILGPDRKIFIKEGRVRIRYPDGRVVEPYQLPSGEQQILTLFGELARRLRPGAVILIDEVEISLHPALQRLVLFHLRRLAEKYDLQFILTTHSMDLVKAAGGHNIVNLDRMALEEQTREAG